MFLFDGKFKNYTLILKKSEIYVGKKSKKFLKKILGFIKRNTRHLLRNKKDERKSGNEIHYLFGIQ